MTTAKLDMKLASTSGYECETTYEAVTPEQWGDVVRVLEGTLSSATAAQPEQPSIKDAELVWPIAQDKWNAQADEYNQWDNLGRDEMSVLIVREAELQLSQIVQPEQPATAWRMRAMDGEWMFCSKNSYKFCVEDGIDAQQLFVRLPATTKDAP